MTELLKSIKADLTDRRLLPIVVIVAVALVGAGAYAALSGGSGGGESSPVVAITHHPGVTGIAVSEAQTTGGKALAETTNGVAGQRHGAAHDPFVALPGPSTAKTAKVQTGGGSGSGAGQSTKSSSGSGSSTSSSSQGGGGSPPASKPKAPSKPKTTYKVALQFGELTPGVFQASALPSYTQLSKPTPLPSSKATLIEFLGVTGVGTAKGGSGKSATFALEGEVILHGQGACRPSATQCTLINLKVGQSEQLEYLSSTGQPVVWELRVIDIATDTTTVTAASARAQSGNAREARARAALLQSAGMRWSGQAGVIVFVGHRAHAARHAHR